MKEFVRICKVLGVKKSSTAIRFCEKWANETQKPAATSTPVEQDTEQEMGGTDFITYENRPRLPTHAAQKQQWYDINSQYLSSVLSKGVNDFVKRIDDMICSQAFIDPEEFDAKLFDFNQ